MKTILVVDDDPDILEALVEILEAEGYATDRARNGKEALERLSAQRPHLILLDLMMPVMDGSEFAVQMKKRPEVADVPVIVLSADRSVATKALEMGARGWLAKPFELSDLMKLVRSTVAAA